MSLDSRGTKDDVPEKRQGGRHEHDDEDEFANGAPAGNLRNKHTDEGRPRNPPRPVQHGPCGDEFLFWFTLGGGQGHHVFEVLEKLQQGGGNQIQDVERRPSDENEDREADDQAHVDIGQDADAALDAGHRGKNEKDGEDRNDHHHDSVAL